MRIKPGKNLSKTVERCAAFLLLLAMSIPQARADESLNDEWQSDTGDSAVVHSKPDASGPIFTANDHWVGPAVIAILGFFLAAAIAGPIVRTGTVRADTAESNPDQREPRF